MRVAIGAASDIGRARERNEDSYVVEEPLFAVADGMGGHRGGAVASSMALETLREVLRDQGVAPTALIEEIKTANQRVLERGEADRELRGMGTTLTALLAEEGKAHIAHIGDSRAYLLRDGSLKQLTEDHTLVQRMVMEGKLLPEEAERHPQRSILTRALGVDEEVEPDTLTLDPVLPGDRLLLCTDGLTSMVDTDRIEGVLQSEHDPQRAADILVDQANAAGGDDNITVLVLDFIDDSSAEAISDSAMGRQGVSPEFGGAAADVVDTPDAEDSVEGDTGMIPLPAEGHRSTTTIHESRPMETEQARRRRRRWVRLAVWSIVVAALLIGLVIGGRFYLDNQWFVGVAGDRVAIYNGIPTEVLGVTLSHVEESTNIPARRAEQLRPWRGLSEGITANSLEEARDLVTQIRRDVSQSRRQRPA
ncbi:MAG TPA: Stp1/IreP family PP2C-type Ser/Thr phosphatase [Actinomycetota bacterium]|nr:Stp1/IreP family PP2C-type Ser/Thr phosphatase [Actinomycetota bacterium]